MSESLARNPRGVVTANGASLGDAWLEAETEENEFTAPDTFAVRLAMGGLPADKPPSWWASAENVEIEIFAGVPNDQNSYTSADLTPIFLGVCDDIEFDWTEGTIHLTGRDLTAPLIDTKTSEKYINQTASQIASTLAGKYGLTPVVTETTEKAGKLYARDHVELKDERTEWDLLTWLGDREGFVTFVRGRELHFQPKADPAKAAAFVLKRQPATAEQTEAGAYVSLVTNRTLTVAGDIEVTVKSWNSKKKRAFSVTAKRLGRGSGLNRGGGARRKQKYERSIPGLTQDQAQQRANQILAEVSKHAMRLAWTSNAGGELHMDGIIRLEGTGSDFDQTYFPDRITRTISASEGWSWTVEGKNSPTESEPTL